jgi:hypothetical protein
MVTYKIIGGDGKEYGLVTADDVRHWIAEGRLNGKSLVQAEGSSEWKMLSALPEFADALGLQVGQATFIETVLPPASNQAWPASILSRSPELRIGRCLTLSLNLLKENLGLLFGSVAVVWLIGLVCRFIPFVGPVLYWVMHGVFYGGLYLVFLNRIRGRPASIGDAFAGFSLAFAQLLLAGLVSSLLSWIVFMCCLMVPSIYLFVAWVFSVPLVADKRLEFWSAMELSRKVVTRVWFEVFCLLAIAFLPFVLTYILVMIKMFFLMWPALQNLSGSGPPDVSRMIQMMTPLAKNGLALTLLIKFILLLNLPFALGALMYAYEDLFGSRIARTP